jgi:Asp-tRNA(Asn)/Glu-tRNA(Gln) amidotransferase B subunit
MGDKAATSIGLAVNYLLTDLVPLWSNVSTTDVKLSAQHFAGLIELLASRQITSRVAKDLLIEFALADKDLVAVVTERGLLAANNSADLEGIITAILSEHGSVVEEYKAGKVSVVQFLVGQVMKQTKGASDPLAVREALEAALRQ